MELASARVADLAESSLEQLAASSVTAPAIEALALVLPMTCPLTEPLTPA